MITYDLDGLIKKFRDEVRGVWHEEARAGNDGSAGNTLEDLLGVPENNLKIPDWGDFEIKTKKKESSALLTLLHREPLPKSSVPELLLSLGWRHQKAGEKYENDEMSFRSTTRANDFSDRGFAIKLEEDKISFVFDPSKVAVEKSDRTKIYRTYGEWLDDVESRSPHYSTVLPVYWERQYLMEEIRKKLDNTFLVMVKTKREGGKRYFRYEDAYLFSGFLPETVDELFNDKALYVDFDARTRHNHGTKFRVGLKSVGKLFSQNIGID